MVENEPSRRDLMLRHDIEAHARILTEFTQKLSGLQNELDDIKAARELEAAVAVERKENLDGRLKRIESSIANISNLGKWVAGTIGAVFITAVVGFVIRGGFSDK